MSSGWKCALSRARLFARCVWPNRVICSDCSRARARARHGRARSLTGDKWFDRASMEAQPEPLPNENPLQTANRHRTRVSHPASERRMSIFVPHFRRYRIFLFFPCLFFVFHADDIYARDVSCGETCCANERAVGRCHGASSWFVFVFASLLREVRCPLSPHSLLSPLATTPFLPPDFIALRRSTLCASVLSVAPSSRSFFLPSTALYSRMFIWRICIIYACCGTPLGSAL